MKDEAGKLKCGAVLVVDKFDPLELIDLYVSVEDWGRLVKEVFGGRNRVTVALRMKGVG